MSKKIYHYTLTPIKGAIRAFLPIIIYNPFNGNGFPVNCLVDTGADSCMVSGNLAIQLGHDLKGDGVKSGAKVGIKEEKVTTWKHTFQMHLLHPDKKSTIWTSSSKLFECIETEKLPVLLGVSDFLCYFRITFDYPEGILSLEI